MIGQVFHIDPILCSVFKEQPGYPKSPEIQGDFCVSIIQGNFMRLVPDKLLKVSPGSVNK